MTFDVDAALAKLSDAETGRAKRDERVLELIQSKEQASTTVTIGTVPLKVRAGVSKKTTAIITKTRELALSLDEETMTTEDVETLDKLAALAIASMCLEAPFNEAETWLAIGEETGDLSTVVDTMLSAITDAMEEVASFRKVKKGRRTVPSRKSVADASG